MAIWGERHVIYKRLVTSELLQCLPRLQAVDPTMKNGNVLHQKSILKKSEKTFPSLRHYDIENYVQKDFEFEYA